MARIPLPSLETMTPEQRQVHKAIGDLRGGHIPMPYRPALHNPELADNWQRSASYCAIDEPAAAPVGAGDPVVARHHGSEYMRNAHEKVALKEGVGNAVVEAIKNGSTPNFDKADERAVYNFSNELLESKNVSDACHAQALSALGVTALVELTALLGYYVMVAMMLNAHDLH